MWCSNDTIQAFKWNRKKKEKVRNGGICLGDSDSVRINARVGGWQVA